MSTRGQYVKAKKAGQKAYKDSMINYKPVKPMIGTPGVGRNSVNPVIREASLKPKVTKTTAPAKKPVAKPIRRTTFRGGRRP